MLRKLINDWIHVSSELVLEDGKMACTCLGDFCWEVAVSNAKNGVTIASKEEFCYNSVGFSDRNC